MFEKLLREHLEKLRGNLLPYAPEIDLRVALGKIQAFTTDVPELIKETVKIIGTKQ